MTANRLIHEKSPYLLQHAHNPVDWYPWGHEAFQKAAAEDKPIFLSVGYSTCHWCHVMERESFEKPAIAEVLNRFFVPVKVDREERPDVDRIYMTFVQASTGSGGWPMSVWLTPDLKPFFGGTYFPPDGRWGRPGFRSVLEQLAHAWHTDRAQIVKSGDDIVRQLNELTLASGSGLIDASIFDSGFFQFRRSFDSRLGGFGGAPKFPRPAAFQFLFRYFHSKQNDEAREMVLLTLREMAKGGMNDQLGGGFHRYSVDARWFVPHFEKMLYDQAQLAVSYLEAFQITADPTFAQVARSIFDYVLRDMSHPEGGFFSAEDADSVIDPANPHEKGEGAFYIWSREEIDQVLEQPLAEWFSHRYGVEAGGNVAEDPHGEFRARNILYSRATLEDTAARFGISEDEMRLALSGAAARLLKARDGRVRPHLDDKVLTGWNGLMIAAFAKGAQVLGDVRYLEAARRAAEFVLARLRPGGVLKRRWRDGEAAIDAFLDDYAFLAAAMLNLHQTDLDCRWLHIALDLTDRMRELFEDADAGGFFSTAGDDSSLVLRIKEDYDGAEPSGNAIAIQNLSRLARITGREDYQQAAERALRAFAHRMASGPSALPQMLASAMFFYETTRQVVLAGELSKLGAMLAAFHEPFLPFHTLLWSGSSYAGAEARTMIPLEGRPTAYVCENLACQLPTTEVSTLRELLK